MNKPRRRLRSKAARYALAKASADRCALCAEPLPDNWHADHVVPYRRRPETNVHKMQATCPRCNLKKGAS
jgi:5-methylcytosine-specific restriction endonuclease McrA